MGTHYRGTPRETRALDTFIKLMRAADSVYADLHRHLGEIGLTHGQLAILEALLHLGPLSQQQLAAKIMRSGSNVTTVLDNLEKQQLVRRTRRADDRRVVDVSLTSKGRRHIAQRFPLHARRITALFAALEPHEQAELGDLCKKLGRGVRTTGGVRSNEAPPQTDKVKRGSASLRDCEAACGRPRLSRACTET